MVNIITEEKTEVVACTYPDEEEVMTYNEACFGWQLSLAYLEVFPQSDNGPEVTEALVG